MVIRPMRPGELAFAAECTAREGWAGETLETFKASHDREPEGCLLAEEAGRPLGICVATSYGGFGFIGELIVRPEARGRGIGPRVLRAAVEYLGTRGAGSIYLDGVVKAVPFYELSGFRRVCLSLRFSGRPLDFPPPAPQGTGRLRPMRSEDLSSVRALDREAFGADRGYFLERLSFEHPEFAWLAEDEKGIAGYILAHPGRDVVAVGPWVVSERWARPIGMLEPIRDAAEGLPLRIGVLETNAAAGRAFRSLPGLAEEPPSLRMVLGPSGRLGNSPMCWAIGSPAKG